MEINEFIKNFANQFDETDITEFQPKTNFRELEEWSSLVALAVMNMIGKKYGVKLSPDEMRTTSVIKDLFALVQSKK